MRRTIRILFADLWLRCPGTSSVGKWLRPVEYLCIRLKGATMPGVHTFYDGATFLQPIAKHYGVQVDK
ncbi:hypothetical protein ANCDUO_06877, partial [Ancylostoma duodenale]